MKGLIYKDLLLLKKQLSTMLLFILVYGGLCAAGVFDLSIISALIAVFGLTIPMTSVSMDDATHWDRYAVATPAGRKQVVAGKYLFTLLIVASASLVGCAIMVVLALTGLTDASPVEMGSIALTCGVVSLLLDSILLPFMLKYGAEKARMISMITFVLIFGGSILLGSLIQRSAFPPLPARLVAALPLLLALAAIVSFFISYCIAQGIYRKKEF